MQPKLTLVAAASNDLAAALHRAGFPFTHAHADTPEALHAALEATPDGGALAVLSDTYPAPSRSIPAALLAAAKARRVRLFLEYPDTVEGVAFGAPATIVYERLIAADDFLAGPLCAGLGPARDAIIMANGCYYRPADVSAFHLCLAKAAGYDRIVYGLPEKVHPILFAHPAYPDAMLCTTALSCFVRARFAPAAHVEGMWLALLYWLTGERAALAPAYDTRAAYGPDDALPADCEARAIDANLRWFDEHCIYSTGTNMDFGVIEGFESAMDCCGNQYMRQVLRSDCLGESAMAMAVGAHRQNDPRLRDVASKMIDHMLRAPVFYHDDPQSPMYGLINWFEDGRIFYGDDNARALLGALAVRTLLRDDRWDEKILRCAYANLRTSGKHGFRYAALRDTSFDDKNWTDFYAEDLVFISPHYTAYLWATYLWLYALTGRELLLAQARTAIRMTMEAGIKNWRWQNSLSGEMTRMLLPLAFLVRVDDTPTHRAWLSEVVDAVLPLQDACGAIADIFGDLSLGKYPPPQSNERYGTAEASLIQENGDPATDLLYTLNWAFIGLHEASLVLDDARIKTACDRIAAFLCRIQVRSAAHPKLDGAWMRSFDYKKWEYWGSGADIGWGAWCIETGWVNTWITTTLALRAENRSLLSTEGSAHFTAIAQEIEQDMLIDRTRRTSAAPAATTRTMPGSE